MGHWEDVGSEEEQGFEVETGGRPEYMAELVPPSYEPFHTWSNSYDFEEDTTNGSDPEDSDLCPEDAYKETPGAYTFEHDLGCGEETAEVGYPLYNCGEMPSLAQPGPILSCDDIKLGKDLSLDQREALRSILWKNEDVFAFTPEQLGRCTVAQFDIRLKEGAKPVAQPYYKCPFKHREAFKTEIDKMVELGLLKPSNSPWSSPVVLVPKKDNTLRVTFDYRKGPNTWLEKDEYPLPRLDEILALLGGARYFCAVDATKKIFANSLYGRSI
jgi:hypothetical protein